MWYKSLPLHLYTVFSYFLYEGCGVQLALSSITEHNVVWEKPKVSFSFLFELTEVLSPSSNLPVQ